MGLLGYVSGPLEVFRDPASDRRLEEAHRGTRGDLYLDVVVTDRSNGPVQTRHGDDLVPWADALDQLAMALHPLLLWPDEHEVEDRDQKPQEDEAGKAFLHRRITSFLSGFTRCEPRQAALRRHPSRAPRGLF